MGVSRGLLQKAIQTRTVDHKPTLLGIGHEYGLALVASLLQELFWKYLPGPPFNLVLHDFFLDCHHRSNLSENAHHVLCQLSWCQALVNADFFDVTTLTHKHQHAQPGEGNGPGTKGCVDVAHPVNDAN